MLEPEGAAEALPERLLPADAPGAGLKLRRLALQSHVRGLVEQVEQLRCRQGAQGGAAVAAQFLRERLRGLTPEPEAELAQRGVEDGAQRKGGRGSGGRLLALPDHVQDDILEGGVAVMPMCAPAAGTEVNLDVTGLRRALTELDDGAAEIRTAFDAAETRMKDTDRLTVQGCELIAKQSLVLPDGLQKAFGRRVPVFPQDRNDAGAHAPLGIKAGQDRRHLAIAFALMLLQCQASDTAINEAATRVCARIRDWTRLRRCRWLAGREN